MKSMRTSRLSLSMPSGHRPLPNGKSSQLTTRDRHVWLNTPPPSTTTQHPPPPPPHPPPPPRTLSGPHMRSRPGAALEMPEPTLRDLWSGGIGPPVEASCHHKHPLGKYLSRNTHRHTPPRLRPSAAIHHGPSLKYGGRDPLPKATFPARDDRQ